MQTLELLRFLGSPFAQSTIHQLRHNRSIELYNLSMKNRMLFLYLQTLSQKCLHNFADTYQKERARYSRTVDAITRASQVLANANIEHAVFKTVRPYASTTVDIDIIIFGDERNCIRSAKAMQKIGYKIAAIGPRSITLLDPVFNIGVDLYDNVAVSFITYLDKEKIAAYVAETKMPNGVWVRTLEPHADLATIIAHSVIKEQLYTLAEYYTFIHYLKNMNIMDFIEIVKETNITFATRTHAALTGLLHKAAHKTAPEELQKIHSSLGEETLETTLLIKNKFKTPHKYNPVTLVRALLEIAKGERTRSSMAMQLYNLSKPSLAKDVIMKLGTHIVRETY